MSQQTELSPMRKRIAKYLTYFLIFLLNAIQPIVFWTVTVASAEIMKQFSILKLACLLLPIAGDLYILWDVIFSNLKQDVVTIGNYFGNANLCCVCGLPFELCECNPMRIAETQDLLDEVENETAKTNRDTTSQ